MFYVRILLISLSIAFDHDFNRCGTEIADYKFNVKDYRIKRNGDASDKAKTFFFLQSALQVSFSRSVLQSCTPNAESLSARCGFIRKSLLENI
jgi:hypothetical protein